jgi:hypothetical protein
MRLGSSVSGRVSIQLKLAQDSGREVNLAAAQLGKGDRRLAGDA